MDFRPLTAELQDAKYSAMTDEQAADDLNLKNITVKQPITSHNIRKYLTLVDKLLPIEDSPLDDARKAERALDIFESFDVRETMVLNKLTIMLDELIAINLLDMTDKATILAMGEKLISRSEQLNLPFITEWQVKFARSL